MDIDRLDMEGEIRDFYLPITKNSLEKHQQYFTSLARVMKPTVNFFKNNEGASCMATLYGYELRIDNSVDDQDEEGQKLWIPILDLILSFVGTMRKSHEFKLYAYGMAFDEGEFGWFLYSTGVEVPAEHIYKIFLKDYDTI